MTHVYFHCSSADQIIVDRLGTDVLDLIEARERAVAMVRSLVAHAIGVGSFRDWYIHIMDEDDDELLTLPFETVIGRLH